MTFLGQICIVRTVPLQGADGPLAQLVEQRPFKAWVTGSNPVRLIFCLLRLVVRTPGFHPGNRGSTPLGDGALYLFMVQSFFFVLLYCMIVAYPSTGVFYGEDYLKGN